MYFFFGHIQKGQSTTEEEKAQILALREVPKNETAHFTGHEEVTIRHTVAAAHGVPPSITSMNPAITMADLKKPSQLLKKKLNSGGKRKTTRAIDVLLQ